MTDRLQGRKAGAGTVRVWQAKGKMGSKDLPVQRPGGVKIAGSWRNWYVIMVACSVVAYTPDTAQPEYLEAWLFPTWVWQTFQIS